jgi:hypothetical protein
MIGFSERITYSANWSETGAEWSQVEGFLQESDLTQYLESMGWRIVRHQRERERVRL